MRSMPGLALGMLGLAALAWSFAADEAFNVSMLVVRALGFGTAAVAAWHLHWVRRVPLAIGVSVAALADILPMAVDSLETRNALGWTMEGLEVVGSVLLLWAAWTIWRASPAGVRNLSAGVALQTVTAVWWVGYDLTQGLSPYFAGNVVAVVAGAWFLVLARGSLAADYAGDAAPSGAAPMRA